MEVHRSDDGFLKHVDLIIPRGRMDPPEDIAPAGAFLASPDATGFSEERFVGGGLR